MSDSELSEPGNVPDAAAIEQCLRRIVRDALKAEKEVSINSARVDTERQLGLEAGFLKSDDWKSRSKEIISAAVEEPDSPEAKKSAKRPNPKPQKGTKRKSEEAEERPKQAKTRKKTKRSLTADEDDDEVSGAEGNGRKTKAKDKKPLTAKRAVSEEDEDEQQPEEEEEEEADVAKADETSELSEPPKEGSEDANQSKSNVKAAAEDEESEMSEVFDEPPAKKKRQKKSTSPSEANAKGKKSSAKPAKVTKGKELTADEEEIKRLQGWLLKCGIRKVWGKELKKFETDKAKIKHLKSMLEDVGMTGRYSAEKAKQIKDQRELAAEIESAQEFNKTFGKRGDDDESEEDEEQPRTRGLKPKGLVDLGDSGDED